MGGINSIRRNNYNKYFFLKEVVELLRYKTIYFTNYNYDEIKIVIIKNINKFV